MAEISACFLVIPVAALGGGGGGLIGLFLAVFIGYRWLKFQFVP